MTFERFIRQLLSKFPLHPDARRILTTPKAFGLYRVAFTQFADDSSSAVGEPAPISSGNYQIFEQLGDATLTKFLVWYFYHRFPHLLKTSQGVKVVARLRIKYGSNVCLASIADRYGFWDHIRRENTMLSEIRRIELMEDVFEAFIGATEVLVDDERGQGVGYLCVRDILRCIYDEIAVPLTYENLFDAKTRLKELCDAFREVVVQYRVDKIDHVMVATALRIFPNGESVILAVGRAHTKVEAEQDAADQALKVLKKQGIYKKVPRDYLDLESF